MPFKISYTWPNPLFILWAIGSGFLAAFFYYCAINLIAIAHQTLLGYEAYGIMIGFFMLMILPYMLGLQIIYEGKPEAAPSLTEEPGDDKPVGNDYFIPLWGWLRYQLPNLIRRKRWVVIVENMPMYFLVGILNGLYNYPFTPLFAFALIVAVIAEYYIYYKNWMPFMKLPSSSTSRTRGLAYLLIQEHGFSFMAVGWIIGLFLIGKL